MTTTIKQLTLEDLTLDVSQQIHVNASVESTFAALLEQMGPGNERGAGDAMPMVLEAWPGGRWYRDLGNGAGHFWGHVQAIRSPTLLEICGPLFMSYPAVSNVQYRLAEENGMTRLKFTHRAMGYIAHDREIEKGWAHIESGWENLLMRIRSAAALRTVEGRGR